MKTWRLLGYAGLLPFVVFLSLSTQTTLWLPDTKYAFIAYSAIILSFIAGSLWRVGESKSQRNHQIISNIFSLLAFSALLIDSIIALTLLALGYLFIFVYEARLVKLNTPDDEYITMRTRLTASVIVMHLIAFYLWFG
jgi:hypothetical protein